MTERLNIDGFEFHGPFPTPRPEWNGCPGVYAVLTHSGAGYAVLDIGQSDDIARRLAYHDRQNQWIVHASPYGVVYAAHLMPGSTEELRCTAESRLRGRLNPPCGER